MSALLILESVSYFIFYCIFGITFIVGPNTARSKGLSIPCQSVCSFKKKCLVALSSNLVPSLLKFKRGLGFENVFVFYKFWNFTCLSQVNIFMRSLAHLEGKKDKVLSGLSQYRKKVYHDGRP